MKRRIALIVFALLFVFALWECSTSRSGVKTRLPQDVLASCTIEPDTFKTWFAGGKVTDNGLVTAANSVAFLHRNNCDFYQWSERMFLWVTSPVKKDMVFNSALFYSVAPVGLDGGRELIANIPGQPLKMSGHLVKVGPNRLPVMKDNNGKLFEIEITEPASNAKETVKDGNGKTVTVDHVEEAGRGMFRFVDKAGKTIINPRAIIAHHLNEQRIVHRFKAGHQFVFLDSSGRIVESEEGQATGDVLMSQGKSLVYYLIQVNDVFAWYMTMSKNTGKMTGHFPTDGTELKAICAYARTKHITLPDSNALAIEIKSSWVEASTLGSKAGDYITTMATIPTYDTSNARLWVPKGEKTVKMALVGMHVVGSVASHPEMIWATFEHQDNTPNAAYTYLDKNNQVKTMPQDTGKGWLFSKNASDLQPNVSHMTIFDKNVPPKSSDTIRGIIIPGGSYPVSPSNTLATMVWGSATDSLTNPESKSSAASNSQILSINNDVRKLLGTRDLRKNYLLIGATWTENGAPPNGKSYGADKTPGVAIGTNVLANTTMETYFQTPSTSCLTCHSGFVALTLSPDTISHIFAQLLPLGHKNLQQKTKSK